MKKTIFYIVTAFFIMFNYSAPVKAEDVQMANVKNLIVKHSKEMGIDPAIALSIAKAESGFCHDKRSKYGAVGVFQLMPSTAKRMGYDPYHVQDNIKGGIEYYKLMLKMFGSMELALAAYNAGPGNVKKYNGIPPFKETQRFVSSIMSNYRYLKANPNIVLAHYKNPVKEVTKKEDLDDDFRKQQEEVLQLYLANIGI